MDRSIPLLLIGLMFGGGLGFTVAAANGITLDGHDHGDPAHHVAGHQTSMAERHDHATQLSLPSDAQAPTLDVSVEPDPASGWNLHLATTGFAFAPLSASGAHVLGEGHAHLYVNGQKRARIYGAWTHLAELPAGDVELRVTLNANDHRPLAVGDVPVEQVVTVAN
ncbi:hypothetical protein SAMN05444413_12027 [Roseivivax marinus]|uniref:hypothetical protein n=1 Tax=Roseivivax marinus TaxID=1379903 RepID=UPI0008B4F718|nr:hypothetical protein [Roseivivax marinus]SEL89033.1 hypothetical protein SAMN05444413_12027 [Roseivivax marinus]